MWYFARLCKNFPCSASVCKDIILDFSTLRRCERRHMVLQMISLLCVLGSASWNRVGRLPIREVLSRMTPAKCIGRQGGTCALRVERLKNKPWSLENVVEGWIWVIFDQFLTHTKWSQDWISASRDWQEMLHYSICLCRNSKTCISALPDWSNPQMTRFFCSMAKRMQKLFQLLLIGIWLASVSSSYIYDHA